MKLTHTRSPPQLQGLNSDDAGTVAPISSALKWGLASVMVLACLLSGGTGTGVRASIRWSRSAQHDIWTISTATEKPETEGRAGGTLSRARWNPQHAYATDGDASCADRRRH